MFFARFVAFVSALVLASTVAALSLKSRAVALNVATCTDPSTQFLTHDCDVALLGSGDSASMCRLSVKDGTYAGRLSANVPAAALLSGQHYRPINPINTARSHVRTPPPTFFRARSPSAFRSKIWKPKSISGNGP
ncbi:hypothetical protein B0H11DRAFT_2237349 [Mycena galericulata]|nr:hypothetical protein B0H11DRAFT_2237349 [Mycena galericulata]